jgi:ATP-dependent Clp protease, proteolytic subunit ClpP
MNKFWSVKNFVNQDGTGQSELILYGDISDTSWWGDEITPREFASDLASCNGNDLTMRINSGGGDVFAAQAIHNMIKTYTGNVTAHIDGLCASASYNYCMCCG